MISKLKQMLQEERLFSAKQKQHRQDKEAKDKLKVINRERAAEGKSAIYAKKTQMKQTLLKDKFEKLNKEGKLDRFMEKQHEEFDRKRARRN